MVSTTSGVLRMLTSMKVCTAEVQRGMLGALRGQTRQERRQNTICTAQLDRDDPKTILERASKACILTTVHHRSGVEG